MSTDIYIIEDGGTKWRINWLPDTIKFKSGGTRFTNYEILDLGNVQIPNGKNIRYYSWEGIFPGEGHKDLPWLKGEYITPAKWQERLSIWQTYGTKLTLVITGTPIAHTVYLEDYEMDYKGAYGDYHYKISFIDARFVKVKSSMPKITEEESVQRDTPETTTYTVVQNDTLWSIAQKLLGDGNRWEEIYELNKETIESTALKYPIGKKYGGSDNGHWIFPDTVLKIPGSATASGSATSGEALTLSNVPIYVSSDATKIATRVTGTYYLYDGKEIAGRYRITNSSSKVGKKPVGQNVTGWMDKQYA